MEDSKEQNIATKRPCDMESKSPLRNASGLFANHTTYHCASNGCIPCAYKICCFDVALDQDFCRIVPNQRPEQCPRSSRQIGDHGTLGYKRGMKVLTVGDGDFSFSLALARIMSGNDLTVTSYESKTTLIQVYPQIKATMTELESLGATLHFNVDATRIQQTLDSAKPGVYDRIVWNFPCEAVAKGKDGQNDEMENNKQLISEFISSAKVLLVSKKGQIQINHKTKVCNVYSLVDGTKIACNSISSLLCKPPFNQWKIEDVAISASKDNDDPPLQYYGRICFDRCLFPPYIPRKALDKKSFPVHDACTFMFGLDSESNPLSDAVKKYESLPDSLGMINVNEKIISHIRQTLLTSTTYTRVTQKRQKLKY